MSLRYIADMPNRGRGHHKYFRSRKHLYLSFSLGRAAFASRFVQVVLDAKGGVKAQGEIRRVFTDQMAEVKSRKVQDQMPMRSWQAMLGLHCYDTNAQPMYREIAAQARWALILMCEAVENKNIKARRAKQGGCAPSSNSKLCSEGV